MLNINNFTPFFGVVENNDDPERLGRVQVRCYGYHTDNKAFIPTEYLIWFSAIVNNMPGMSGLGASPTGYLNGTTVFGFFVDKELQTGIILGALCGKPSRKIFENMGFTDPDGVYPFYYDESDVNRIARNENLSKTIIQYKKDNRVLSVPDAVGSTWDEPETDYNTQYPDNKVFETASGHVVEYDDTPGAERISINHKTGSFQEYHADGKKVEKVNADAFTIFLGGHFIFVNGNLNQVVGGDHYLHVMGDYYCKVGGTVTFDTETVKILGESEATDHKSSGVSGKDHKHTGVQAGMAVSGKPEPKGGGFSPTGSVTYNVTVELFDPDIRKD